MCVHVVLCWCCVCWRVCTCGCVGVCACGALCCVGGVRVWLCVARLDARKNPLRAEVQHASVCTFKTPPCVPAKRPHIEQNDICNSKKYPVREFSITVLTNSNIKNRIKLQSLQIYIYINSKK